MEDTIKRNIKESKDQDKIQDFDKDAQPKENETPSWVQRVAAGVIDVGLLVFLFIILVSVLRMSGLGTFRDKYYDETMIIQKNYATTQLIQGSDETFYHKVYINDDNMLKYENTYQFSDEGEDHKYVIEINQTKDEALLDDLQKAFDEAIAKDKKFETAKFNFRLVDYGINMIACAIGEAILILAIPLLNKRRVTIGQYLAGERCINVSTPTQARWWKILIRYFWVIIFEIALPCLTPLNIYAIIVTPIILYIIALFNKRKRTIRDYITSTRFVDNKTYVQFGRN